MKNNSVKVLYGSQNFGYNTSESDRDFLEFVFPTWGDLLKDSFYSKERKEKDGSVTKVKDVRLLLSMLLKANVNDLQVLYSVEVYNKESLKWFFDNRDDLVKMNLSQCFKTNAGYVKSLTKKPFDSKNYVRAYMTLLFLKSVTENKVQLCFPQLKQERKNFDVLSEEGKQKAYSDLKQSLNELKPFFVNKNFNSNLFAQCKTEMSKVLKQFLY